jgi:hypothetical protein
VGDAVVGAAEVGAAVVGSAVGAVVGAVGAVGASVVVVAWQTLPVMDSPVTSVTHLPEQHCDIHLQVLPPSTHVGADVGTVGGSDVGVLVVGAAVEGAAVVGSAVGASVGVVGSAVGASVGAVGASVGAVGANVALQLLPVLDVVSDLQIPLQQSLCHLHSSSP